MAALCLRKMRDMLAPELAPRRRVEPGEALWTLLNDNERAFICRWARVDSALISHSWKDLPDAERDAIVHAWNRLREWVERVQLHIDVTRRYGR